MCFFVCNFLFVQKLENLLLTNRGNLKISDFGHAGIYRKVRGFLVGNLFVVLNPRSGMGSLFNITGWKFVAYFS